MASVICWYCLLCPSQMGFLVSTCLLSIMARWAGNTLWYCLMVLCTLWLFYLPGSYDSVRKTVDYFTDVGYNMVTVCTVGDCHLAALVMSIKRGTALLAHCSVCFDHEWGGGLLSSVNHDLEWSCSKYTGHTNLYEVIHTPLQIDCMVSLTLGKCMQPKYLTVTWVWP